MREGDVKRHREKRVSEKREREAESKMNVFR
jgi:hypothetical protein